MKCDPPKEQRLDDITMGNTYLRNTWCVENPNIHEVIAVMYFLGYLIWDTIVCVYFIGDVTSGAAQQNLLHHAIGILGCIGNIYVGTYVTTMSCASMITEISTPFINLRWFLATHKKTDGTLYFVNGLTFTLLFFVFRNVFQTWMLVSLFFPAVVRDDFGLASN